MGMVIVLRRVLSLRRPVAALTLVLVVGGCSRVKFAYNYLDWILESRLEAYLDLEAEQEAYAEAYIGSFVQWHRQYLLPRYAQFLTTQAARVEAQDWNASTVVAAGEELSRLYRMTMWGAAPGIAEILSRQDPRQIDHFEAKLAERHAELAEKAQRPPAEVLNERVEKFQDAFERFMGGLRPDQMTLIRTRVRAMFGSSQLWLDSRKRRYGRLLTMLREGRPVGEVRTYLIEWFTESKKVQSPAYQVQVARFREHMQGVIHEVIAASDAEQRTELVEQLRRYAQDFSDLAGDVAISGTTPQAPAHVRGF